MPRQRRPDARADRFQSRPMISRAFTDARVAAIKAGLRLTPEQEKNWPAFEAAYRNLAKLRTDRVAARARTDGTAVGGYDGAACSAAPMRSGAAPTPQAARRYHRAALPQPRRRAKAPLRRAGAPRAVRNGRTRFPPRRSWSRPMGPGNMRRTVSDRTGFSAAGSRSRRCRAKATWSASNTGRCRWNRNDSVFGRDDNGPSR